LCLSDKKKNLLFCLSFFHGLLQRSFYCCVFSADFCCAEQPRKTCSGELREEESLVPSGYFSLPACSDTFKSGDGEKGPELPCFFTSFRLLSQWLPWPDPPAHVESHGARLLGSPASWPPREVTQSLPVPALLWADPRAEGAPAPAPLLSELLTASAGPGAAPRLHEELSPSPPLQPFPAPSLQNKRFAHKIRLCRKKKPTPQPPSQACFGFLSQSQAAFSAKYSTKSVFFFPREGFLPCPGTSPSQRVLAPALCRGSLCPATYRCPTESSQSLADGTDVYGAAATALRSVMARRIAVVFYTRLSLYLPGLALYIFITGKS